MFLTFLYHRSVKIPQYSTNSMWKRCTCSDQVYSRLLKYRCVFKNILSCLYVNFGCWKSCDIWISYLYSTCRFLWTNLHWLRPDLKSPRVLAVRQAKSVPFCPQIGTFEKVGTIRNKIGTAHDRCCDWAKYCICYACSQINAIPTGINHAVARLIRTIIIFSSTTLNLAG